MPAAKDEFTAEQYADAQRFGLTLDQVAEADAEIADLERMNKIGFHPGHFENKSWADAILARPKPALQSEAPIEAALQHAAGPPVSYGQRPPQTEPPMKMQKGEESPQAEPPLKEQNPETPAQEPPRKMQKGEEPQQAELSGKEQNPETLPPSPPMRMQLPQPPAPPMQEVRYFATENAHSAGAGHHV